MPLRGFLDLHNHQFANLGFGGLEFFGLPSGPIEGALPWCTPVHGPGGILDGIGTLIKPLMGIPVGIGHKVGGFPQFDGWPRFDSLTHQAVHKDMLRRAWQGGLRLMVVLAVNNEWMCSLPLFRMAPGRTSADMEAVRFQLAAAKGLEAEIDQESGGPGTGWYRIVRDPYEAYRVIESGRLAVILGIEVDFLFGSYLDSTMSVDEMKSAVKQAFDDGVRYIFPIHFSNNLFGGTAYQNDLIIDQNDLDVVVDLPPPLGQLNKPYHVITVSGSDLGYQRKDGKRNVQGLTEIGKVLIAELMQYGILFDVDHMSYASRSDALDIAESKRYPVLSGHSGFVDIYSSDKRHEGELLPSEVERIRRSGGMVAPIINQGSIKQVNTHVRVDGTSIRHVCGNTVNSYAQAYVYAVEAMKGGAVGLGTDFNGFAGLSGPVVGADRCYGGIDQSDPGKGTVPGLAYPFIAVSGQVLDRQSLGQRTFDVNSDGLTNVGMLPDFIAALSAQGVRDSELNALHYSADALVRVWARAWWPKPGSIIPEPMPWLPLLLDSPSKPASVAALATLLLDSPSKPASIAAQTTLLLAAQTTLLL